jgi:multidrug resistance efflux pump/DNA-binding MarR family transcriptional regulator
MDSSFTPIEQMLKFRASRHEDFPYQEILLTRLCMHMQGKLLENRNKMLKAQGINETLFMALITLESQENHSIQPSELSCALGSSRTNATRIADELEKRGWIERRESDNDRRCLHLQLTEKVTNSCVRCCHLSTTACINSGLPSAPPSATSLSTSLASCSPVWTRWMKTAPFLRRCANATTRSTSRFIRKPTGQHVTLLAFLTTGRLSRCEIRRSWRTTMSANAESTTPQQPANKKGKRKSALLLLTLLFIIIAVAYGIYWFLVLRHAEETDDAYVAGNQVQIMAQVSGSVTKVWADNTDFVQKGDVLVTLDPTDAQQAFEKAQTALASSVRQTRQLMINSKQLQANIDVQKTALAQAQSDLNRRVPLGTANLIGREELQHARDAVASAQAQLDVAIQQYNANQAMVLGTSLENQPAVLQAATEVRNAWLALQRTKIVSPMTGYVSRRSVQPGAQISPTTPLMAVVPATICGSTPTLKRRSLRICVSARRRLSATSTAMT